MANLPTYSVMQLPMANQQQSPPSLISSTPSSAPIKGLQAILDLYAPNTKSDMRVKQRWQGGSFTSAPPGFNAGKAGRFVNSTDYDYYNAVQANNAKVLADRETNAAAENMNQLYSQNPFGSKKLNEVSYWGLPQFG